MISPEIKNLILKALKVFVDATPYIVGFVSALLVEPIRKKIFKPNLVLDFKDNQDFRTLTPETTSMGESQAVYVRVCVKNKSWYTASGCRAHLVNVEQRNSDGEFERTDFVDSLRLAWSCQPSRDEAFRAIDIPKNVNQFIDVFSTRPKFLIKTSNFTFQESIKYDKNISTFKFEVETMPLRYLDLTQREGEYRYTILVTADGVDPKFIKLLFKWTNDWMNFEVSKIK